MSSSILDRFLSARLLSAFEERSTFAAVTTGGLDSKDRLIVRIGVTCYPFCCLLFVVDDVCEVAFSMNLNSLGFTPPETTSSDLGGTDGV